jgi:SAM-dependent methyltransferase
MIVYNALNKELLEHIPDHLNRVLDVGCGDGSLGVFLKSKLNVEIVGITFSEKEALIARTKINTVIVGDLNSIDLKDYGKFDCVICSHVLEHVYDPVLLLKKIKKQLTDNGILIIALPNILFWKQRIKLLRGSFKYTDGGLMDRTHFRFFDWETAQEMIQSGGFTIEKGVAYGAFPLPVIRNFTPKKLNSKIDEVACQLFPGLFGFQFVFSCKPNM